MYGLFLKAQNEFLKICLYLGGFFYSDHRKQLCLGGGKEENLVVICFQSCIFAPEKKQK